MLSENNGKRGIIANDHLICLLLGHLGSERPWRTNSQQSFCIAQEVSDSQVSVGRVASMNQHLYKAEQIHGDIPV